MRWLDYVGLALSTSLAAMLQLVWMLVALRRRLPPVESPDTEPFVRPVLQIGVASLGVGVWAFLLHRGITPFLVGWQPNIASLLTLLIVGGSSALLYLLIARLFHIPLLPSRR
jgi:peptidoglycan biosynthesis protein MviN/MurJ (putative lipid II flippase)